MQVLLPGRVSAQQREKKGKVSREGRRAARRGAPLTLVGLFSPTLKKKHGCLHAGALKSPRVCLCVCLLACIYTLVGKWVWVFECVSGMQTLLSELTLQRVWGCVTN